MSNAENEPKNIDPPKQVSECHPTKPCTWDCWDWFSCCGHGKNHEKCYRFNKQNKLRRTPKKGGKGNG